MSRMERQIQLNNLESVIEKKKREIQAKLEAQKKKETEEALLKIQKSSEALPRRPFWKGKGTPTKSSKVEEPAVKLTNVFSNDGSFLDHFKKLSKSGLKPDKVDVETLAIARNAEEKEKERRKVVEEEKTQRQIERNMRERERELRRIDRGRERDWDRRRPDSHVPSRKRENSPKRVPLDANIQIDLPPPGMVQLVPQVQIITPVVLTSLPQLVLNPPPSFTTNEIQLQATGVTPSTSFPPSSVVIPSANFPPTTGVTTSGNFPPSTEMTSSPQLPPSLPGLPPPIGNMLPSALPPMPLSQAPITAIPPPLPMTPYSIPPPSPMQVDSIPPPPLPPGESPPKKRKKKENAISSCALPPPGYCDQIPLPPFMPLPEEVPAALRGAPSPSTSTLTLDSGTRHLAKMVATRGDDAEEILRVAHKDDPSLRFLFDTNCVKYKVFRNFIEAYRSGNVEESDDDARMASDKESDDEKKYDPVNADDSDSSLSVKRKQYDPTVDDDSDSDSSDVFKTMSEGKDFCTRGFDSDSVSCDKIKKEAYDPTAVVDSDSDDEKIKVRKEIKFDPTTANESGGRIQIKEEVKYDPMNANDSDSGSIQRFKRKKGDSKYDPTASDSDSDRENGFKIQHNADMKGFQFLDSIKSEKFEEESRPSFSGVKTEDNKSNVTFVKAESESTRKRRSRWGDKAVETPVVAAAPVELDIPPPPPVAPPPPTISVNPLMLSQITRREPGLLAYARQTFGSVNLSEEDWKRAEDHYKINLLYQNMMKKREELDKLARAGKFKYEYDSDEDTEGGTWEHKLRNQEMTATQLWADELTRQAEGKHHIGDFLPPDELERFLEKYNAVKSGREPDLSDYKEFKLREDNVGYKLLQKMGWNEGQGLGQEGQGMVNPVNKANTRMENQGLGIDRPDGVDAEDDEYTAYRKRMMLAYRFRPNPLNNPRRPYY